MMICLSHYRTLTALDRLTQAHDEMVCEWRDTLAQTLDPYLVSIQINYGTLNDIIILHVCVQAVSEEPLQSTPASSTPVNFESPLQSGEMLESPADISLEPPEISILSSGSFDLRTPLNSTTLSDSHLFGDVDMSVSAVLPPSSTPVPSASIKKSRSGFKLVGDNLDKSIKPREMREDHQKRMLHCFHMYGVSDRVNLSNFSDIEPQFLTEEFQHDKILPSKADSKLLIQNIATLIVRILCSHVPFFKQLDEVFVPHIQHDHSDEMAQMSKVVCLD